MGGAERDQIVPISAEQLQGLVTSRWPVALGAEGRGDVGRTLLGMPATRRQPASGPFTYTLDEARRLLGVSQRSAYRAVERGTFPVAMFKAGGQWACARWKLHELLGITAEEAAAMLDTKAA